MKQLFIILSLFYISIVDCNATLQCSDILIYKGDTLYLSISPLEKLHHVCIEIKDKEEELSSECWNGFTAEWLLEDGNLYLKNIFSYSTGKNINKRLERIIKKKFVDGKMKADWFTGSFYGGFGRHLDCLYFLVYEKERYMEFDKGILKLVKKYDAKNTEYSIDESKVKEFVYSNLDWDILKNVQNSIVIVYVEANSVGEIKRLEIENSGGKLVDDEVKRVLRLIPNWGIYYWQGEEYEFFESYHFRINLKNKQRYSQE